VIGLLFAVLRVMTLTVYAHFLC